MKIKLFVLVLLLVFACSEKTEAPPEIRPVTFDAETLLGKNQWRVKAAIFPDDTVNVLKVIFTDELALSKDSVYCTAMFESDQQYRLVAPWIAKHVTLQKNNVLKDEIQIVPRSEALK